MNYGSVDRACEIFQKALSSLVTSKLALLASYEFSKVKIWICLRLNRMKGYLVTSLSI